jgi:antitoxin PrlF
MSDSTVTAKGQTTVPADIRNAVGCVPGTRLEWHVLEGGRLFVRVKNKSIQDLKGMFTPPKGKRVSLEDLRP